MVRTFNVVFLIDLQQSFVYNSIEASSEQANKRAASPNSDKSHLEYLIRGELIRECPTLAKTDGKTRETFASNRFFYWEYF